MGKKPTIHRKLVFLKNKDIIKIMHDVPEKELHDTIIRICKRRKEITHYQIDDLFTLLISKNTFKKITKKEKFIKAKRHSLYMSD